MAFSKAVLALLYIGLARFLGPELFGHIRVIGAGFRIAVVPAALGMPTAIAKYVAEYSSAREKENVYSHGISFSLLAASVTALAVFFILAFSNPIGDEVARRWLMLLCWAIPLAVFTTGAVCYLQGQKLIKKMAFYQFLLVIFRVVLIGGLAFSLFIPGYALGILATELIGAVILFRVTKPSFRLRWERGLISRMFRLGIFASLGLTFATLTLTIDTLCLSAILQDPFQVGVYGAAASLAMALLLLPEAILQTFFPYLSEQSRNRRLLRVSFFQLLQLVGGIMLIIGGAVFLFAPAIVEAIFGREYLPAAFLLRVLIPGIFAYSLQKVSGITLFALGKTDLHFYAVLIACVADIVLNIIFIKRFGLVGAAWATSTTFVLRMVLSFGFLFLELRGPVRKC